MTTALSYEQHPVLSSAQFIASHSIDVHIDISAVERTAQLLLKEREKGAFALEKWKQHELNPKTMDEKAVDWIFLVDSLNFCFWASDSKSLPIIEYRGKEWTGYWSLCAAVNRALEEGIPITSPTYMKEITLDQLSYILRSKNNETFQLLPERVQILKETGRVLLEKFEGSFVNCIRQCKKSSRTLIELVIDSFSSYRDEAHFLGRSVKFYKRAQILVADLWACFEGKSYGEFHDLNEYVTMFADYRVPQALVYLGILQYSHNLLQRLRTDPFIPSHDRHEIEIRGCSIWAVEVFLCDEKILKQVMLEELKKKEQHLTPQKEPLNAVVIDYYLWDFAKKHSKELETIPIHKTRTIFY